MFHHCRRTFCRPVLRRIKQSTTPYFCRIDRMCDVPCKRKYRVSIDCLIRRVLFIPQIAAWAKKKPLHLHNSFLYRPSPCKNRNHRWAELLLQ
jgi:hypothetical protein